MSPARRPTDPRRAAHSLPEGLEREITPIHGVRVADLDSALLARSAGEAAALTPSMDSGAGVPLWAKIASVPAMVLLLAGLLLFNQQRSDAQLKEARADARQDRAEFREAINKLAGAVERSATAQEKTTAAVEELRRDMRERRSSKGER